MTNNVVRVTNWIRRELTTSKPSGDAVRFELRHLPVGGKRGNEVASPWHVPEKCDIAEWCELIGNEVVNEAERDADGIADGFQRYVLLVFRSKTPDKNQGRLAFNIDAPEEDAETQLGSEPPTKHGLQAQLMRHLEAVQRNSTAAQSAMVQAMAKMLNSVTEENQKLREQRLEMYSALEDVLTQREERALKVEESKTKMRVMEEGAKKLAGLLPVVVNRIAGNKPETRVAVAAGLLDSFSDEQKAKLLQAFGTLDLTAEQQTAASELFATINNH